MQKILTTTLFIGILVFVLSILSFSITFGATHAPPKFGEIGKINLFMKHSIDPDVIIFGGSTALVDFDSDIIEKATTLSVYNMGLDGTPFPEYWGLVQELMQHSKKCKRFVFVITFLEFSSREDMYEPCKYYPYLDNDNIYDIIHALQPVFAWKMRNIPFYSFTTMNRKYFSYVNMGWRFFLNKSTDESAGNGFLPIYKAWGDSQDIKNRNTMPIEATVDNERFRIFREIMSRCKTHGFEIFLVMTPIQQDGMKLFRATESFRDSLSTVTPDRSCLFDYTNDTMCLNKEYFYNNTHLNYRGAEVFSRKYASDFNRALSAFQ